MTFAIVTGSDGGLGSLIVQELYRHYDHVIGIDRSDVDISDNAACKKLISNGMLSMGIDKVDALVNCAGKNELAWIKDITDAIFENMIGTNARGILNMSQACLPYMQGGTICNIVSNASHMAMRTSAAYCASKAAALQLTRCMARELKGTDDITVFSISPNKLRGTKMSTDIEEATQRMRGWTVEEATAYQLASLPAGVETEPGTVAEFIGFLLSSKERHRYLHGCDIPYGA